MLPDRLTASVAAKHIHCHASANLELAIPGFEPPIEDPTVDNAANRGTRLHELFAELMHGSTKDAKKFSEALEYVSEVRSRRRFRRLIEKTEDVVWLHAGLQTTADLVLYVRDEIHVLDLKTGRIPVEVTDNYQLLYYAATYGHYAPNAKGVHLHIVQPWADNMEEWFADTQTIADFMQQAVDAQMQIDNGDTTFTPGDWCTFCPANPHARTEKGHPSCPAMMRMLYPEILDEQEILKEI